MDIGSLKREISSWSDVYVDDEVFLCSESGQSKIKDKIGEEGLSRVVVAACSPSHHYKVFKDCIGEKINSFLWELVNIREQCSWVHEGEEATSKALSLISGGVEKAKHLSPIYTTRVPVNKNVLVVGGGITGIQTALELESKGHRVYLVEKDATIGGNMVKLDKTFPTDDCSMCTISPKLSDVASRDGIEILTYSEVEEIDGRPGDYHITINRKPRYVDQEKCTGCGNCAQSSESGLIVSKGRGLVDRISLNEEKCINCGVCVKVCEKQGLGALSEGEDYPSYHTADCTGCFQCVDKCPEDALEIINPCPVRVSNEFDQGLSTRAAIYLPFPQAVPSVYLRDPEACLELSGEMKECMGCTNICPAGAIIDDPSLTQEITVGAIVVATGHEERNMEGTEYNLEHPDVITGLQLERMLSAFGPTEGVVRRPSDGEKPKTITFVQCVGSRDARYNDYCSKICCMYAMKQARLIKQESPDTEINICYMDMRAGGRWYEEYYRRVREMGINFIRGNAGDVLDNGSNNVVRVEDTLEGEVKELPSDLVVLSTSMNPSPGTADIKRLLGLRTGEDQFLDPSHPKIEPVDTTQEGVYIAGTCSGPKPIQESITDANAAASRASTFLVNDEIEVELITGKIDPEICIRCDTCFEDCNYEAVFKEEDKIIIDDVSCKSCGKCSSLCPTTALTLQGLTDEQIESQVRGILKGERDSIVAFCCVHCSYNAADLAGLSKKKYSPRVKIVRLPCTGKVSINHILTALNEGAVGVMVAGCLEDECHYLDGNFSAREKVEKMKDMLDLMGIGRNKVEMFNMSSSMASKWIESVQEFEEGLS